MAIDQLNLDAYLPVSAVNGQKADAPQDSKAKAQEPAPASLIPPEVASLLEGIDTNTKVAVGTLTLNAVPVKGLVVDIGLLGGELTIRKASVEDMAGGMFAFQADPEREIADSGVECGRAGAALRCRPAGFFRPSGEDRTFGPTEWQRREPGVGDEPCSGRRNLGIEREY